MTIHHDERVIYAIECKNTTQAKIAYDFYSEIVNYLGTKDKEGMVAKHVRRDTWLKDNSDQEHKKLGLSSEYVINSFVLTKNILPTIYIRNIDLPLYSYSKLTGGKTNIALC
jgi:hypothetical protein